MTLTLSLLFDARKKKAKMRARLPWGTRKRKGGFRPIEQVPSYAEVDVETAEDNFVCIVCEDISENGPYELDEAEDLIPAHPHCRCAFVPAGRGSRDAIMMVDAKGSTDPTRTRLLRIRMRADGDRRWQTLSRTIRQALIEHDLLGQRGIGRLPHADKTEGFAAWLRGELDHKVFGLDGSWVRPYIRRSAEIAQVHAARYAPDGRVDASRVASMETLTVSELHGIIEAAQQQITRAVTRAMMANHSPTKTANAVSGVIRTMCLRTRAMAEFMIAKTHATSTLSAFRHAGVQRVGTIPENLRKQPTRDYNPHHEPAGSPGGIGGRFASAGGGSGAGQETAGERGRAGGRGGAGSPEQAQRSAEAAAAGYSKLAGLPDKPIKIGDEYYVPGPLGKAKDAAAKYMRDAGLPYDPPKQYLKVDKERATRIANEFDRMKHDPDNPAVKASYEALTKETIAQWHAIRDTGLKVEWIKEGQNDPYAKTPRLAAMDVIENNHWWGFPTDAGFGTGEEAEKARHNNPMLQMTDEVVDGKRLMVNDVFRIVHDYFGHFKEGVGFRADGEENAWRSHAAMYSDLARGAMTSETRGQNSWVNYGPYGESNRTASAADTHYAPQKIGLMPEWTQQEGRRDIHDFDPEQPRAASAPGHSSGEFASWGGASHGQTVSPEQAAKVKELAEKTPGLKNLLPYLAPDEVNRLNKATVKKMVELFSKFPVKPEEMAAVAFSGSAKRGWYEKSAKAIVDVFGTVDAPRFAALTAALSPQTGVEDNAINAINTWANWIRAGRPTGRDQIVDVLGKSVQGEKGTGSILPAWINNSVMALSAEDPENIVLSGPKVDSFAENLRAHVNAVTLDSWMANYLNVKQALFARRDPVPGKTPGKGPMYIATSAVVRKAAEILTEKTGSKWTPAEVQETIWSWAKTLYERATKDKTTVEKLLKAGSVSRSDIADTADFATLFTRNVYSKILEAGGYGKQAAALATSSGESGFGHGRGGGLLAAEGSGIPQDAFTRFLIAAARRLDKVRAKRAEDAIDYNPYHLPGGSPEGGRFTSAETGGSGTPLDPKVTEVGGDEWNKQTAMRLEREYQHVKPDLEKLAASSVEGKVEITYPSEWKVVQHPSGHGFALQNVKGDFALNPSGAGEAKWDTAEEAQGGIEEYAEKQGGPEEEEDAPFIPESWDEIGDTKQEEIKNDWMEKTTDEFLKQEIDNWMENGDAMDDTKSQLAYNLNQGGTYLGHSTDNDFAFEALKELVEDRREAREQEIPFTNEQLMDAMHFEYESGYQGMKDVEITWNEEKLGLPKGWVEEQPMLPGMKIEPIQPASKLTEEMREAIEKKMQDAFNKEADNKVSDAEPPEYLKDNIDEYQDSYWEGLLDKDKFKWAQDNGHVEKPEEEAKKPITLSKLPDKFDPLGERAKTQDYQLTKLLGGKMSVARTADVMVQRGVFDDRNQALRAAHTFENRVWAAWKGDSSSTDGLILQAATASELGGRFRNMQGIAISAKDVADAGYRQQADDRFGSSGGWDGIKAYVRAKWETSQYLLDKADKPEVNLYRAILLRDKGRDEPVEVKEPSYNLPFHYDRLPEIVLHRNGAQSTTTDPNVANDWKGVGAGAKGLNYNQDRVVFRMRVPRTAVLGLPAYGQNLYGEREVVLAGTAWKGWDAWHRRAPRFEEAPI